MMPFSADTRWEYPDLLCGNATATIGTFMSGARLLYVAVNVFLSWFNPGMVIAQDVNH